MECSEPKIVGPFNLLHAIQQALFHIILAQAHVQWLKILDAHYMQPIFCCSLSDNRIEVLRLFDPGDGLYIGVLFKDFTVRLRLNVNEAYPGLPHDYLLKYIDLSP
jgi:hypothetical protein